SYLAKNYSDSIKYYETSLLSNTYSIDPKIGLIKIYLDTHSFDKVQMIAYEVIKVDYNNFYANLYMAQALIAQEKYEIATEIVHKILRLYPTNVAFLETLAAIYKKTDTKNINELYENILILDPNNIFVHNQMR
ncbi:hypothetical protein JHD48_10605, partial [Sulfurimonas sp. SAG-AH-194-I05]